jgi:hypothetical protein
MPKTLEEKVVGCVDDALEDTGIGLRCAKLKNLTRSNNTPLECVGTAAFAKLTVYESFGIVNLEKSKL